MGQHMKKKSSSALTNQPGGYITNCEGKMSYFSIVRDANALYIRIKMKTQAEYHDFILTVSAII